MVIMPYIYFKDRRKLEKMAEGGRELGQTKEKSVSKV